MPFFGSATRSKNSSMRFTSSARPVIARGPAWTIASHPHTQYVGDARNAPVRSTSIAAAVGMTDSRASSITGSPVSNFASPARRRASSAKTDSTRATESSSPGMRSNTIQNRCSSDGPRSTRSKRMDCVLVSPSGFVPNASGRSGRSLSGRLAGLREPTSTDVTAPLSSRDPRSPSRAPFILSLKR